MLPGDVEARKQESMRENGRSQGQLDGHLRELPKVTHVLLYMDKRF